MRKPSRGMPGTLGDMGSARGADMTDEAQRQHLRFTLALHEVLAAGDGNACFSPYSIECALGMAYQAARGSTAAELLALLNAGEPDIAKQVDLLRTAAELDGGFDGDDAAPVIAVANTLWAWEQLPLNEGFLADLAGWPGAKLATAPFVTDPEAARQAINADVAQTTRDLIEELVPSGAIDPTTIAALVNALYLKTAWREPFVATLTADEEFHAPGGTHVVPTMRRTDRLRYAMAGGWVAVTVPAAGGVEAVLLLPDSDLPDAESALDAELLLRLLGSGSYRRVALHLPKLDIGMNTSLVGALGKLGVRQLFSRGADLSGLSDHCDLAVSDAVHEAVLKVDEDGIEGAAATAIMIRVASVIIEEALEVRFDRPFLMLVRHAATGAVYFLARVSDPS